MWNSWHFSFQRWRTGDLKSRCVRPLTNSHTVTNKKIWKWNSTPEYLETFFRNSCPWAMTNEYQNNVVALKIIFCENCRMPQSHDCSLWNHNLEHFRGKERKMNLSWWTKIGFEKKELIFSLANGEAFERKWTNDDDLFLFYCVCLSICKEQRTFASIVSMFMSIFNPYVSTMLCHWKPLKSIKWRSSNNLLFELLFAFVAT